MRKGQVSSRIFVYILVILVFSFILLFGYKSIGTVKEKSEQAQLIQLKVNLREDIVSLASQYGSVDINEYDLPLNIGKICFVDLDVNTPNSISSGLSANYPLIADQIEGGTKNNLFLFDEKGIYTDSLDVGKLNIHGPGWICYKNDGGKFRLELTGKGDRTELRKEFSVTKSLDVDEFVQNGVILEIEEMPKLKLVLKGSSKFPAKVKLSVKKGEESGKLSDSIFIETLNPDGLDYSATINFKDGSYVEIPVPNCASAGEFCGTQGDLGYSECYAKIQKIDCQNDIVKYKILKI